jgi:phage RecT family recombinase
MSEIKIWEQSLQKGHKKLLSVYSGNSELVSKEVKAKALQELGFAYQFISDNEQLQRCTPISIINAVTNIARTSITLNPVMRLAYLVPRNGKCVLDFSYMGMVSLLKSNGNIKTINSYIVYEDEDFEHDIVNNIILHKPKYVSTEKEHLARKIIGAYSVAKLPTNDVDYCFMPFWEIDKIKKSSKGGFAWKDWQDEMIKKTVIKRHFKMLISINNVHDSKLNALLEIENDNNGLKECFNNKKGGLKNAFVKEEVSESRVDERVAMLVDENTKAEIDAENQAIIDELEGKDLISDADVTEVENKNNLFSE